MEDKPIINKVRKVVLQFAKEILNDFQAVYQGFISSWSNGPVEAAAAAGQVNRPKNIKKQMYGIAGFELLRKRGVITSQS